MDFKAGISRDYYMAMTELLMSIDGSAQDPILLEEPSSSKKMIWTKCMDRVFLDFLIDQVHLGRKCEGGFKKEAWAAIERQFNAELTMNLSKDQFKNKLKTWKQGFKLVRDLKSKSGFGWNEATQTVEAADSVWDKLFESREYRSARMFKRTSFPYYNDLARIFSRIFLEYFLCKINETQVPKMDQLAPSFNFGGGS